MRKIPTVFRRDPENMKHALVDQITPGCEWVLEGEGVATRKWDGTCVMLDADGPVREDGKRLKPDGWTPPDIKGVLERVTGVAS